MLLVLDNFEQVIDGGAGGRPSSSRPRPNLAILTQQPKRAPGLRRAGVPVPPLGLPDPSPPSDAGAALAVRGGRAVHRARAWRCGPTSRSRTRTRRRWPRSASASTACRSPSSSPRRGSGSSRRRRCSGRLGDRLGLLAGGRARPSGTPADAARRDRVEPRPARRDGPRALRAPVGVRRRRRAGRDRDVCCGPRASATRSTRSPRWSRRASSARPRAPAASLASRCSRRSASSRWSRLGRARATGRPARAPRRRVRRARGDRGRAR